MALPAYDQCIKASHVFNLLDARGGGHSWPLAQALQALKRAPAGVARKCVSVRSAWVRRQLSIFWA